MRFLCRLIASIWILFTAKTKPVRCRRLAQLLCRYFSSNSNQYCIRSKPVVPIVNNIPTSEFHQYYQRIPRQYCASSKTVICQFLAQYLQEVLALLLGYNWHNTAPVVKTVWPPTFPLGNAWRQKTTQALQISL